jgi:quinol monooxygenase YgiN
MTKRLEKRGSLLSLRLLTRIPSEKRKEFLESLKAFVAKEEGSFCRNLLLKDVDDETLFCWMGDWDSEEKLEDFMKSDTFRALRGAAQVLGALEELRVVEDRNRSPAGETK